MTAWKTDNGGGGGGGGDDDDDAKTPGFEKSMERLERIVTEMESGKLTLEDMIVRFEEGQGLIRLCGDKLNEVEKRIEILVKKGENLATQPFDAEKVVDTPEKHNTKESLLF